MEVGLYKMTRRIRNRKAKGVSYKETENCRKLDEFNKEDKCEGDKCKI